MNCKCVGGGGGGWGGGGGGGRFMGARTPLKGLSKCNTTGEVTHMQTFS